METILILDVRSTNKDVVDQLEALRRAILTDCQTVQLLLKRPVERNCRLDDGRHDDGKTAAIAEKRAERLAPFVTPKVMDALDTLRDDAFERDMGQWDDDLRRRHRYIVALVRGERWTYVGHIYVHPRPSWTGFHGIRKSVSQVIRPTVKNVAFKLLLGAATLAHRVGHDRVQVDLRPIGPMPVLLKKICDAARNTAGNRGPGLHGCSLLPAFLMNYLSAYIGEPVPEIFLLDDTNPKPTVLANTVPVAITSLRVENNDMMFEVSIAQGSTKENIVRRCLTVQPTKQLLTDSCCATECSCFRTKLDARC